MTNRASRAVTPAHASPQTAAIRLSIAFQTLPDDLKLQASHYDTAIDQNGPPWRSSCLQGLMSMTIALVFCLFQPGTQALPNFWLPKAQTSKQFFPVLET